MAGVRTRHRQVAGPPEGEPDSVGAHSGLAGPPQGGPDVGGPDVVSRLRRAGLVLACAALLVSTAQAASTLIDAVKHGDRAAIRTILQTRPNVNAASADGTTALHWAAQLNDLETTQLLLKAGANVRAVNRYGMTPLQAAAVNGNPQLLAASLPHGVAPSRLAARSGT